MTVRQALKDAVARLTAAPAVEGQKPPDGPAHGSTQGSTHGPPQLTRSAASRDAELLLMDVLACNSAALLTYPERQLTPDQILRHDALVERRLRGEPMQYILGEQEFFGLPLKVSSDVLIPRPETEHLVEASLAKLPCDVPVRIADVGAGSGAIAIALARARPLARLIAVDLSSAALSIAEQNAARHGVADRIQFVRSDLLFGFQAQSLDAVVSNPPYVALGEDLETQVRDYEPHLALYAGPSGLEIFERLVPQAWDALKPGGWLTMEIGYGQLDAVSYLLHGRTDGTREGWTEVAFLDDLNGIPRVAIARRGTA